MTKITISNEGRVVYEKTIPADFWAGPIIDELKDLLKRRGL